jgi:hypothetical protein
MQQTALSCCRLSQQTAAAVAQGVEAVVVAAAVLAVYVAGSLHNPSSRSVVGTVSCRRSVSA